MKKKSSLEINLKGSRGNRHTRIERQSKYVVDFLTLFFHLFFIAPWHPVCSMIKGYVSQISKSSEALPVLNSEVQMLLGGVWDHCLENGESEGSDSELFVHEIPWDDLIALCINHKLRDWTPPFNEHVKGISICAHIFIECIQTVVRRQVYLYIFLLYPIPN